MAKNSSRTNALDTAVDALGEDPGTHPATGTAVTAVQSTIASKAADRSAGSSNDSVSYSQLQELVSNQLADVLLKDPGCSQLLHLLTATSPFKDQSQNGYFPVLVMVVTGSAASPPSSGIQRFDKVQGGSDAGTGDAGAGTADSSWGFAIIINGGGGMQSSPDGGVTGTVTTPGVTVNFHFPR